jgi:carboxypeptidase family protein
MKKALGTLACLLIIPAAALAQAAVAGSVSDPSGAPLPGVAVVALSEALIENTRTTLTDGAGRYRIEDLRPGTYQVRFTLAGWRPYQLTGVEVTGSLTAIVDVQLSVGTLSETITVAVDPAAIDLHSSKRALTLTGDVVQTLPAARSYNALLVLVPGVVTNVNDTVTGPATTSFPIHGGRQNEGRLLLDGLNVGSPPSGNSATSYDVDAGQAQEVTFTMSGGLGEAETAGLVMNIVPKASGNTMHGSLFASGSGQRLQFDNLTPDLIAQGFIAAAPYAKLYDLSGTLGGRS